MLNKSNPNKADNIDAKAAAAKAAKAAKAKAAREAAKAKREAAKAAAPIKAAKPLPEYVNAARNAASTLHMQFDAGRSSVPIKSLLSFKAYKPTLGALRCNTPTARQAAALCVAILASGKAVADGISFPRKFTVSGAQFAIENGCAADCVSVGLATYDAKTEQFTLSKNAAKTLSELLGAYDSKLPAIAGLDNAS